jgi:hypothetical protein
MRKVIDYYKRVNGTGHIVEHIGTHESGDMIIGQLFGTTENGYRQHAYDFNKEYVKIDKTEVDALERQTCPSRMNQPGPFERTEGVDFWKEYEDKKTCSFCGSLHPEEVLKTVKEQGFRGVERAKSYKMYVGHHKYYLWHNTPEFVEAYNSLITPIHSN